MVYGSHPFKFIYLVFKENPYLIQFLNYSYRNQIILLNYSYRNQLILLNSYLYKAKLHLILKKKGLIFINWTYIDYFIAYPIQFAICNLLNIIIYLFRCHSIARFIKQDVGWFLGFY